jgi:hypothetical protein
MTPAPRRRLKLATHERAHLLPRLPAWRRAQSCASAGQPVTGPGATTGECCNRSA